MDAWQASGVPCASTFSRDPVEHADDPTAVPGPVEQGTNGIDVEGGDQTGPTAGTRPYPDEPRCRVQETLHEQARRTAAMARERTGVTFTPERDEPQPLTSGLMSPIPRSRKHRAEGG